MMRKRLPLQKGKRRPVLLPLLLGICCFGVLWIQGRTYYGETMALEHRLAGMQLPVLYGVPYSTPTPLRLRLRWVRISIKGSAKGFGWNY